jgi:hypothetical protein
MKKYLLIFIALMPVLRCIGQAHTLATEHKLLQGAWRMQSDTGVTMIFTADSVFLKLSGKLIVGYEASYTLSNNSCDSIATGNQQKISIHELYSFAHSRRPHKMVTCSEITELTTDKLVIKDRKILVVYNKGK